jgi:hypothetical protein
MDTAELVKKKRERERERATCCLRIGVQKLDFIITAVYLRVPSQDSNVFMPLYFVNLVLAMFFCIYQSLSADMKAMFSTLTYFDALIPATIEAVWAV